MRHARDLTGDLPVATAGGLSPVAALVVAVLRGWTGGGPGQAMEVLRAHMTEPRAGAAMAALCDLAGVLGAHRRRPTGCDALHCAWLGADEVGFARFVDCAALGEREAALLMATRLVEGRAILSLTDAAARFGLHLHRASLRSPGAFEMRRRVGLH
jgi:hypothetical protein